MTVSYVCANGHEREKHKSQPSGHGQKPACIECSADIVERVVPMYECLNCEHRWYYTGEADRPTCPSCKGKTVEQVATA